MKKTLVLLTVFAIISLLLINFLGFKGYANVDPVVVVVDTNHEIKEQVVTLNFVGDILAARAIELTMRKNGYDYPFLKIKSLLSDADITFANLESPLIGTATSGKTTPGGTTTFRGDTDLAQALKRAGIDIVSLANNHMKDQGQKGIISTLKTLDEAGVRHAGAGLNIDEARNLTILNVPAKDPQSPFIKVGFLAYNDADVVPSSYHATADQSGTHIMDTVELQADIAKARPQVDVLVISMHSGTEYVTSKPNSKQTVFAHTAIDAGADMVIGHHPHVLQPSEVYNGKYIYYSLGNFVFDQPWPDTKESVLVHMQVKLELSTSTNKWVVSAYHPDILPLQISQFQPQKTTTFEQSRSVFKKMHIPVSLFTIGGKQVLVEKATTTEAQSLGLSGRSGLAEGASMLFVFKDESKAGFWMKDMKFPIDVYWFDRDFKLVDSKLSLKPETYPNVFYPKADSMYVLETAEGLLKDLSLTTFLTGELTDGN